jgi:urocanate hydratase
VGFAAEVLHALARRGVRPDLVTDQTSAHDELNGYVPAGISLEDALRLRAEDPAAYVERSLASMAVHVRAMRAFQDAGSITFDYGNNIRGQARRAGVEDAFRIPGFVPEFIRPLF